MDVVETPIDILREALRGVVQGIPTTTVAVAVDLP
jgi:hypothetical protein